jgi:hypothetical protein
LRRTRFVFIWTFLFLFFKPSLPSAYFPSTALANVSLEEFLLFLFQALSTKSFNMAPSRAEEKQPDGPVSMRRLMALENLGNDTYRSITPAWPPGNGTTAFGGHVYAQAAYAASKTVSRGMTIHVCMCSNG